jgi:hypothetical protein
MDVSGIASQPLVETKLPQAPPRRTGAFDDQHRSQTMLQMAAGFFGSQNFGDGLANAARAIHQGNEDAWNSRKPVIGGPDNAFEVFTNEDGTHRYEPIKAVQDYNAQQQALMADMKNRRPGPSAKDSLDAIGRLSSSVAQYAPEQQAQAWSDGRDRFGALGFEGIPETYNPAYREYGAPVPTMARADAGTAGVTERNRHNLVTEGIAATRAQGAGHTSGTSRSSRPAAPQIMEGYEIRRDPVTGQIMRRKVR